MKNYMEKIDFSQTKLIQSALYENVKRKRVDNEWRFSYCFRNKFAQHSAVLK